MSDPTGNIAIWHCTQHGDFDATSASGVCPVCGKRLRFELRQQGSSGAEIELDAESSPPDDAAAPAAR